MSVGYKPLYLAVRPFFARRAGRLRDASPYLVFRDNRWDILGVTVGNKNIVDATDLSIEEAKVYFSSLVPENAKAAKNTTGPGW